MSWGFGILSKFYHGKYDRNPSLQFKCSVPVISVGNLVVGGSGKTPTVIALVELLTQEFPELKAPNSVAVLSRGFGRKSKKMIEVDRTLTWEDAGDEPILIKQKQPSCAVIVNADRRLSAAYAVNRLKSKLLILDDGFQHRSLARDIDLVCMNGASPLGNGRMIPAGPLREPESSLSRATVVLGIGEDVGNAERIAQKHHKIFFSAKTVAAIEAKYGDRSCFLFAGIANPQRFLTTAKELNLKICGYKFFGDHYNFTADDLEKISVQAKANKAEFFLTTEKDFVRLTGQTMPLPLVPLPIEIKIIDKDKLSGYLRQNIYL